MIQQPTMPDNVHRAAVHLLHVISGAASVADIQRMVTDYDFYYDVVIRAGAKSLDTPMMTLTYAARCILHDYHKSRGNTP